MPSRRNPPPNGNHQPPRLVVPRAEAAEKIRAHLDRGVGLRDQLRTQPIQSYDELRDAEDKMWHWSEYAESLLEGLFDNPSVAASTRMIPTGGVSADTPLLRGKEHIDRDWGYRISTVQSVLERLDTYQEPPAAPAPTAGPAVKPNATSSANGTVFIVHGHDNGAKEAVARTLDRLKLPYTILHEQSDRGQTIIEKLERHADEAAFAVVLLTPDDLGASKDDSDHLKPRARQNVIFEMGFFYAKLGRPNVCTLYKGIEQPSDISGILYTPMDDGGTWRYKLASELQAAGLEVDMNLLRGM